MDSLPFSQRPLATLKGVPWPSMSPIREDDDSDWFSCNNDEADSSGSSHKTQIVDNPPNAGKRKKVDQSDLKPPPKSARVSVRDAVANFKHKDPTSVAFEVFDKGPCRTIAHRNSHAKGDGANGERRILGDVTNKKLFSPKPRQLSEQELAKRNEARAEELAKQERTRQRLRERQEQRDEVARKRIADNDGRRERRKSQSATPDVTSKQESKPKHHKQVKNQRKLALGEGLRGARCGRPAENMVSGNTGIKAADLAHGETAKKAWVRETLKSMRAAAKKLLDDEPNLEKLIFSDEEQFKEALCDVVNKAIDRKTRQRKGEDASKEDASVASSP